MVSTTPPRNIARNNAATRAEPEIGDERRPRSCGVNGESSTKLRAPTRPRCLATAPGAAASIPLRTATPAFTIVPTPAPDTFEADSVRAIRNSASATIRSTSNSVPCSRTLRAAPRSREAVQASIPRTELGRSSRNRRLLLIGRKDPRRSFRVVESVRHRAPRESPRSPCSGTDKWANICRIELSANRIGTERAHRLRRRRIPDLTRQARPAVWLAVRRLGSGEHRVPDLAVMTTQRALNRV